MRRSREEGRETVATSEQGASSLLSSCAYQLCYRERWETHWDECCFFFFFFSDCSDLLSLGG